MFVPRRHTQNVRPPAPLTLLFSTLNELSLIRASDISRKKRQNFAGFSGANSWKKRQNFAGFSGANSRKNRPISRDFRWKKVKICGKLANFAGFSREKSQNSQKNRPISQDFSEKKSNFKRFSGANC